MWLMYLATWMVIFIWLMYVGKYTVRPMDPISKYTEFRGANDIHVFLGSFVARGILRV